MKVPGEVTVTKSYLITYINGGWLLQERPSARWVCHSASEKYFRARLKTLGVPFETNEDGIMYVPDSPEPTWSTPRSMPSVLALDIPVEPLPPPALAPAPATDLVMPTLEVSELSDSDLKTTARQRYREAHKEELKEKNRLYKQRSAEYKEKQRIYSRERYHRNLEAERARSRAKSQAIAAKKRAAAESAAVSK